MKKLGFGLMRLPLLDEEDRKSVDFEQLNKMVDLFLERGFTYFDTAYMYHDGFSEEAFRMAVVERHPRESFTITDKMPMMMVHKADELEGIFQTQLERTGAGYFDYYWLHNLNGNTYPMVKKTDAFDFIMKKKEAGLVKHIGFSFHDSAELLDEILTDHPEAEFVQLQINYADWEDAGVQSHACYDVAVKHGKKVIVMEPVKGGALAQLPEEAEARLKAVHPDMSMASWAVRFAASPENVMVVLSGMSTYEQTADNTSYMQDFEPLNEEEQDAIADVTKIFQASVAVPCTACRYCVAGCPRHIPIPGYFALYNKWFNWNKAGGKGFNNQKMYYDHFVVAGGGKASECIGCRKCERACPQHIKVSGLMPVVADAFE